MKETNQDRFPIRKHPRLKDYDYTEQNYYFVTICTHNKRCLFGKPAELSALGKLAEKHLQEISVHFPGVVVDKYVVMPNHIHGILIFPGENANLSAVVGNYKAAVTRSARKECADRIIWQRSFHDHIIRNQADYERIWQYIEGNPSRWEDDCFYVQQDG